MNILFLTALIGVDTFLLIAAIVLFCNIDRLTNWHINRCREKGNASK